MRSLQGCQIQQRNLNRAIFRFLIQIFNQIGESFSVGRDTHASTRLEGIRNGAAGNRLRFAGSVEWNTPNSLHVSEEVNPSVITGAGWRLAEAFVVIIRQLCGVGAVRIHTPNSNRIEAAVECPGEDDILCPTWREAENCGGRIARQHGSVLPVNIRSHQPCEIGYQQCPVGSPIEIANLYPVYREGSRV